MRPPQTVYRGKRVYEGQCIVGVVVTVNGHTLAISRSQQIRRHSEGFEWGYGGSGPAQLALALVLDATGCPTLTENTYQFFKWGVVGAWRGDEWEITAGEIQQWVEQAEREDPSGKPGPKRKGFHAAADAPIVVGGEGGAA